MDVDGGDRTKSLAGLAKIESELELAAGNLGSEFLGFGDFCYFTLIPCDAKVFDLAKVAFGGLVGFAERDEEIAGVASFHFDYVGFSAKRVDFFAEDHFGSCHGLSKERVRLRGGE